ncbi:cytosolic fe-S cluster assembly factor NAR1 [Physcia stellaris]|nr:cytosolic fe-S cluster assembly factor NAR1 [Physcia stellaris]
MKYHVIRAVVMGNITEAFMASEFFANIPFNELKQAFSRYASPDKASEWRALTVGLLQLMPNFGREKASSVQEVTTRIETMTSEFAGGLGASNSQTKNLQMIVDTAADLSVELAKQQATYVLGSDQVNSIFESETMEDVSQAQGGRGRASDESYGFLDALRKKYASSATEGLSSKEAIRISGKTVEEVGFEKINQQLASLHDLRVVILDGLCIRGILSRGNQIYLQERDQTSPEPTVLQISGFNDENWKHALRELEEQGTDRCQTTYRIISRGLCAICVTTYKLIQNASSDLRIQELDLSRNLIEDFRDVKAIVSALKSLKIASLIKYSGLTSLSLASNNLSTPFARMTISSLKSLNLASNQYTSLAGLPDLSTSFPSLESLSLRSNPITSLTSNEVLLSVTTLDLSSTLLPDFDSLLPIPGHFPRLTTLLTAHTPLHGLPASDLHTIARIKTLTSLNHSRISPQERTNAELYYLSAIGAELSSVPEDKETVTLRRHPRYAELCDTHGAPAIKRETPVSDEPKPGTLAARLTKFTFYLPPSTLPATLDTNSSVKEIQRELPRTVGIYKLKGLVGKMFGLRPMGLRLVWETDEWDPVPGLDDDDDWGVSDEEILPDRDPSKWARREIELLDGTKNVGFWIEGAEARVRVELR